MVEDALREGLATRGLPQGGHEAKGFLSLAALATSTARSRRPAGAPSAAPGACLPAGSPRRRSPGAGSGSCRRRSRHPGARPKGRSTWRLGTSDLHEEHGLLEGRPCGELCGEAGAPQGGHHLTTAPVGLVTVQQHVTEVEATAAEALLTLTGRRELRKLAHPWLKAEVHRGPALVVHWKELPTDSLMSMRYCAPIVVSTNIFLGARP